MLQFWKLALIYTSIGWLEAVAPRCSSKFCEIHTKIPVPEPHLCQSFFNSCTGVFYKFCEISKNTFSYRTPPVAASGWLEKHIIQFRGHAYFPDIDIFPLTRLIFWKMTYVTSIQRSSYLFCFLVDFCYLNAY